jgi:predicted KAP-like P-loop ATPase
MAPDNQNFHPAQWLSADRPIQSRNEDALGRRGFSDALAGAIRGWTGKESLVIALYGSWGSGKSSLKNMVAESLGATSLPIQTVDFNPWQMANRPQLSAAFFDEIGIALGKGDLGTKAKRRAALNRFKRLSRRLQGGGELVESIRKFIGIPSIAVAVIAFISSWNQPRVVALVLTTVYLVVGFIALVRGATEAVVKFFEAGTEVGEKSINEIKNELAADLRELKAPILVVLDDLDRLTPNEIADVFQLIKANGDFPNLIYLILCERGIVENHISEFLKVPGREYLEKIVQVAFDVPLIDIGRVRKVLSTHLDSLIGAESVAKRFDSARWANIFWAGLHAYFKTLRDVNRFVSTLAFQISAFVSDREFEVNPIDLIAIEAIRLFEPDVYKALRSSKELLTTGRPKFGDHKAAEEAIEGIIQLGTEQHRNDLRAMVKQLFPTAEWAFGGVNYSDSGQTWYRDLRICSVKMFDRYFRLSVSEDELSQAEAGEILNARGNRDEMRSRLEALGQRGLLPLALEELGVHKDDIKLDQIQPFITAMLDTGDLFPESNPGMFEVPMSFRLALVMRDALDKLPQVGSRSQTLIRAVEDTSGLGTALEVTRILCDKKERESDQSYFPDEEATKIREAAVLKIKNAAHLGLLQKNRKLAMLLHLWLKWGSKEDVEMHMKTLVDDPEETLRFLKSMVSPRVTHQAGDYASRTQYYIRRNDIEPLIAIDTLHQAISKVKREGLDDESMRAVDCFLKALKRRDLNKSDDSPFLDE